MHWGFPAPGQSAEITPPGGMRWVSYVRNLESPFWIGNLRHVGLRCLIPLTSFVVSRGSKGGQLQCRIDARPVFAAAGIWRDLTDMPVFAELATEPSAALIPVEGKGASASMPLILQRADHDRWLRADWKEAKELVQPLPSAAIVAEADIGG